MEGELESLKDAHAIAAKKIVDDLQKPKVRANIEQWMHQVNRDIAQAQHFVAGRAGERDALALPHAEIEARRRYQRVWIPQLKEELQSLRASQDFAQYRVVREVLAEKEALNRVFDMDVQLRRAFEGDESAKQSLAQSMPALKRDLQVLDDVRLRDPSWEVTPEYRRLSALYNRTNRHGIDKSIEMAKKEDALERQRGRGFSL